MPAIRAVIFDLDDTLYPECAFEFSGYHAVADAFADVLGDPDATRSELHELFDRGRRKQIFNELLVRRGLEGDLDRLVPLMVHTYRTHTPTIELHADALAALRGLRESFSLGLITDGHSETQWNKIDALFLRPRVHEIIVTSDIGPEFAKPHTKAFEMMVQCLGVEPPECAYVADNPQKDFVAPNELGWLTIRIVRDDGIYRDAEVAAGGEPDHTITSLGGLEAALLGGESG
jgi:putative hydrolase of the HAD superfamily